MASLISEQEQFVDDDGEPIVNGYIYIGAQNLDAKLNAITIYSDRALTTVLANPQRTDAYGRSVNKIWVPGKYSIKVEDSANVQKLNDLDRGESAQIGNTILDNVQGVNALTATASPAVTALVNGQTYILTAPANNTGAMTLKIDSTTAYPIYKSHDVALGADDIEAGQVMMVAWNEADSAFELTSNVTTANFTTTVKFAKGADIASSAALTPGNDGNYFNVTGTTAITSIATLGVGTWIKLEFDDVLTLTHHATDLKLPGGANITTAAGDVAEFVEDAAGDWKLTNYESNVKFRGALVYSSVDQTHLNNDQFDVAFDVEEYDTDGIHDNVTNNERLTVPPGVSRVKLSARPSWVSAGSTAGDRLGEIRWNDNTVWAGVARDSIKANSVYLSNPMGFITQTPVLEVSPGDYFTLNVFQNSGVQHNIDGTNRGTWFAMEIIE